MTQRSILLHPTLVAAAVWAAIAPGAAQAVTYSWTSGDFVPGTTAPSPLLDPDILELSGGSAKGFNGISFTNQSGTVSWLATSGSVTVRGGAQVVNQGLWDAQGDDTLFNSSGIASAFTNQGTLRKSGGTGTTTIGTNNAFQFVNSGTIDVQTGTVRFDGASAFNDGSSFIGAGVADVSGNSTFAGAITSQNLRVIGGTQTGNAAAIAGGTVSFRAGELIGTWNIAAPATLVLDTTADKLIRNTGTVLTNQGTVAWLASSGALNVFGGAQIVNQGLWDAQGDDTLFNSSGIASAFTNQGTLRKSGGTGTTTIGTNNAFQFVNGGTIDVQTGTVRFNGASTFNDGSVFTGAGVVEVLGESTFAGAMTSQNLRVIGGTQTGNAASIAGGTVAFRAGSLTGTWNVAAAGTLVLDTTADKLIRSAGTVLTNQGTVAWLATSGSLDLLGGAQIVNQGLWDAQGGSTLFNSTGVASTFTNQGTLRKSGGSVATTIGTNAAFQFVNSGTIEVQTGTIRFDGASTFNDGSVFTGAGVAEVRGDSTFAGAMTSQNLRLVGGTQTGNAASIAGGTVSFRAGELIGTWNVAAAGTLVLDTTSNKLIRGTGLTNQGTVAWLAGSGSVDVIGGAQVVNQGLWDAQGNASLFNSTGVASTFTNQGTLRKSGGTGTTTIGTNAAFVFVNQGVVDVRTGSIALPAGFGNDGTLTGDGRFVVPGTLTNRGTLAPGSFGAGTLTLQTDLLQAAGSELEIDLTSLTVHDLLDVTGDAQVGGSLVLRCLGACSYAVDDVITILRSDDDLSGSFAGGVTLLGFATGAFDVVYDTALDQVQLRVTQTVTAVPEPATYALMLGGIGWLVAVARRRRR